MLQSHIRDLKPLLLEISVPNMHNLHKIVKVLIKSHANRFQGHINDPKRSESSTNHTISSNKWHEGLDGGGLVFTIH